MVMRLQEITAIWAAARAPELVTHTLRCREVDQFVAAAREVLRSAASGGDRAKLVTNGVWALRRTIEETLLPFDEVQLDLKARAKALQELARIHISHAVWEAIDVAIDALLLTENPKRVLLDEIWLQHSDQPMVIWNKPRNERPYGWPDEPVARLLSEYGGTVNIAEGLRSLPQDPRNVVMTSPMDERYCDAAFTLRVLGRGRAAKAFILRYPFQPLCSLDFPLSETGKDLLVFGPPRAVITTECGSTEEQAPELDGEPAPEEPAWVDEVPHYLAEGDNADLEPAILARLSTRDYVYFARASYVSVVNQQEDVRVAAEDLAPGDWVPAQEPGADDQEYLEKADAILRRSGQERSELEAKLGRWKASLQTCISRYGAEAITARMSSFDVPNINTARVDAWAGNSVMAPRDRNVFVALLRALQGLGFLRDIGDLDAYVKESWRAVRRLRDANRQGGRQVAEELGDMLADCISQRTLSLGDTLSLTDDGRRFQIVEVAQVVDGGLVPRHLFGRIRETMQWQR